MRQTRPLRAFSLLVGVTCLLIPHVTLACAVCFGDPGDPISKGINLAIITLLSVTGVVLGGFGAFFVYLAGRTRHTSRKQSGPPVSGGKIKSS
ncbi:MAG: hypothetical protein V3U24_00060 [Candidatus Neomarinimicrobiota bacterium]